MLRPRIQQLQNRPNPARTEVRADREQPATAASDRAEPALEDRETAVSAQAGTAAAANFRRVLCAGLFGWSSAGSPLAYSGRGIPVAVDEREG